MYFMINVFLNKHIIFSYILKNKFNMKIVKFLVSLFNKLFNKQKTVSSKPLVHQELKTDPIVFIKGSPEKNVVVKQEETQPEDISNVQIDEVEKTVESFVESLSGDVKVEVSDDLVEVTKRFTELVAEISVPEIKESIEEAVESLDIASETPVDPVTKPEKKSRSETSEEVKETKKKPTRRGKSKKKS